MFLTCLRKELLHNVLSLRYLVVFVLFVALTCVCTAVRTGIYRAQVAERAEIASLTAGYEARFSEWHQSKSFGHGIDKPPNPLSIIAYGLENELTRTYQQGGWEEPYLGTRRLSLPLFRDYLTPDFVLVTGILCSLLALVLIFDSVCGEAQEGTLRVLLAGPVPRDAVISAKMAAGLVTLLAPLLVSWVFSLAYVVLVGRVEFSTD
jgi:ABC-type transport system involved in multi-copper enzyme maturation permease subunit